MKKSILAIIFTISVLTISNAQENATIKVDIPEGPQPWNNLSINNNPATFQFAIVTDRTGGHRPGIFLDGVQKLNLLQPEFVMSVGDLIEGYTEDTAQLNREWYEFNGFIDSLKMPFFYVPGNHDITNKVMDNKWKELFGMTYYHFIYKDVLFLCLNSEDNYRGAGRGTIDDQQYNYIKKVLEENQSVKWTLAFMHQPLWDQPDSKRWKDVEKLLENRKHTVFVGHRHRYRKYDHNNGKYFILATTGGSSALRGPNFGEFDHVVWITMTDDGPILANLMLEGIWDENVITNEFADFIFPIANNFPVQIKPMFIDTPDFGTIRTNIKMTNTSNYEMRVYAKFLSSKNLVVNPASYSETIHPNDVKEIELEIKGVDIKSMDEINALPMDIKLTYDVPERPEVELDRTYYLRPETSEKAHISSNSITIDGKLNDWGKMDYVLNEKSVISADPFSHKGVKDAYAEFSVRYNDDFVFIGAEITDDDIMVKDGGNPLYQDAAIIFFDGRSVNESSMNHGERPFEDWIVIAISPDNKNTIYGKEQLAKGIKCQLLKTKKGYDVEAAIPVSYINEKQHGPWSSFRFNFMINDYDQSGNHKTEISWKPLWNKEDNYIGSGIFFK